MFILQCPKCRNKMKYQNTDLYLVKKRKKCVYCGFSMSVSKAIIKKV